MLANYHTHTARCGHAEGMDREYVEAAIRSGIKILGFSEHLPCVFSDGRQSPHRVPMEQTAEYFASLRELKKEYASDIELHIGFESEYYGESLASMLEGVRAFAPEYLILGQHYIDGAVENEPSIQPTEAPEGLKKYVDQVIAGIKTGVFTYLAHPDMFNFTGDPVLYRAEMKRLCQAAREVGIPIEYNMLGTRLGRNYPNPAFLEVAAEVGNDFLLGLDAHSPKHLALDGVPEAESLLSGLGIHVLERLELRSPF